MQLWASVCNKQTWDATSRLGLLSERLGTKRRRTVRTGNFIGMSTHAPHPLFRESAGQRFGQLTQGIHSTSEAGQLYSYCILNYQDLGFYCTLVFLRDLLVLLTLKKKNSKRCIVYIWIQTFQKGIIRCKCILFKVFKNN